MSGSAPLVLSCNVRTVDELHSSYSLSVDAPKPKLPPSRPLSIVSSRAFGVYPGNDANETVKALQLEMTVADAPALSHLTVREGAGYMAIHAVDANLIVLDWFFQRYHTQVYLVYNAVGQSITMIPSHPWSLIRYQPGLKFKTFPAIRVLIAHLPGGDGRSYALVKMAELTINKGRGYKQVEKLDVLYVWRSFYHPPQWVLVRAKFPSLFKGDDVGHSYMTVTAFTCGGHAFWANLFRGIMYCRLDAILFPKDNGMLFAETNDGGCELKLDFINLPVDDIPPCPISREIELCSDMYRTIGRSGKSSIKFVTIDGFVQLLDFVNCTLKVWTLSPDKDMTRWTKRFLYLGSLAQQEEFKKAGLPTDMVPMYPSLSEEEDGIVYFMLGQYKKCCSEHKGSKNRCNGYIPTAKNPRYHLRVDMRRGVLLASARLPDPTSPSVSITSTSVIQRGSTARVGTTTIGRKDGNKKGL